MRLDDAAVHTRRKSKVIRIDDEPPQTASLAGRQKQLAARSSEVGWHLDEVMFDRVFRRHLDS